MGCISSKSTHPAPAPNPQPAAHPFAAATAAAAAASQSQTPPQPPPNHPAPPNSNPDTAVLRQANRFDQLHAHAHKQPSLKDVRPHVGEHNKKLLHAFEEKHRLAHAPPQLRHVHRTDLRNSKLFDTLQEYEMNDQRARNEPKLQTTFSQRQQQTPANNQNKA